MLRQLRTSAILMTMRALLVTLSLSVALVADAHADSAVACTAANRCVSKLMDGLGQVHEIQVNARFVCWSGPDSITCQPKPIGPEVRLVTGEPVRHFAIDAMYVYWSTGSSLRATPLLGGPKMTLASTGATEFALGGRGIYWVSDGRSSTDIVGCALQGGTVTTVDADISYPYLFASDGVAVYWLNGDTVYRQWGGPPVQVNAGNLVATLFPPLPQSVFVRGMTVDTANAYLLLSDGEIVREPLSGAARTTIANSSFRPGKHQIASNNTAVFWTEPPDVVSRIAVGGGPVATIATPKVHVFAVDATSLYYATSDGSLFKVTPN